MAERKTSAVSLSPASLEQVVALTERLETTPPLTSQERSDRYAAHRQRVFQAMLAKRQSYGEANDVVGMPSFTAGCTEQEFHEKLATIDNDLLEQLRIVQSGVDHYFAHGEIPAPYYAWRIGVILRKVKEVRLEAEFLAAFAKHFKGGNGSRYALIAERAIKAWELARKQAKN
jgi:hypothetical protein